MRSEMMDPSIGQGGAENKPNFGRTASPMKLQTPQTFASRSRHECFLGALRIYKIAVTT